MRALARLVLATSLLVGCATPAPPPDLSPTDPATSQIFDAPKDVIWDALVREVSRRFPVKSQERESGKLATGLVWLPAGFHNMNAERWIHDPGGYFSTWHGLRMSMNVVVEEPEPGKTNVNIQTRYEAFEENVTHSWAVCVTNGTLEHEILTSISEATGATSTDPVSDAQSAATPRVD